MLKEVPAFTATNHIWHDRLRQQVTKEYFISFIINVKYIYEIPQGVVHHPFDRLLYSSAFLPEVNKRN